MGDMHGALRDDGVGGAHSCEGRHKGDDVLVRRREGCKQGDERCTYVRE